MKRLFLAALCVALSAAPALAQTTPVPPAAIAKLATIPATVANTGKTALLNGIFTDDAVIIDENDPYEWRGATAGTAWWARVAKVISDQKMTRFHATAASKASEFLIKGQSAYLILPYTISALANGKPMTETGLMTFTFRNVSGAWKISTMVWSTLSMK